MTEPAVVAFVAVLGGATGARVASGALRRAVTRGRGLGHARARGRPAVPSWFRRRVAEPVAGFRIARRYDQGLPDVVEAVARSLRSGASLRRALADAAGAVPGPVADDLGRATAAAEAGVPLAAALEEWAQARPRPDVLLVVASFALAIETGGAAAGAVDGVAATLRRRHAARAEAVALGAQARASAVVLTGAPLAFALVAVAGGGGPARFLLGTPPGLACLAAGLGLDLLGGWWMARITRLAPS